MKVKRKEVFVAVALGVILIAFVSYISVITEEPSYRGTHFLSLSKTGYGYSGQEAQQSYQVITETIEGELERGTFERVVDQLVILVENKGGYVKSLRMTYVGEAWSGQMTCKLPTANVASFTFNARKIIDENGTVTYINISIEEIESQQQPQENPYSTIYINLKEEKPQSGNSITASLAPVIEILSKGLLLIAQGTAIGVPICFASLGVVLLVSRGLLPLWKSLLKKPKVTTAAD